jgi:hypothetical protein
MSHTKKGGPCTTASRLVGVTSAASGGGPFSPEALLADPRWRCRVFQDHSHARGRRGGRTMECTRAFDLPSESRFARHRSGTWRAIGVVSPHTRRGCASPVVTSPGTVHFVQSESVVPDAAKKSPGCTTPAVRDLARSQRARHPATSRSWPYSFLAPRSAAEPMQSPSCFVRQGQETGLRDDLPFAPGGARRATGRSRRRGRALLPRPERARLKSARMRTSVRSGRTELDRAAVQGRDHRPAQSWREKGVVIFQLCFGESVVVQRWTAAAWADGETAARPRALLDECSARA